MMIAHEKNHLSHIAHLECLQTLTNSEEAGSTQEPNLTVQIGYHLDPGIQRRDLPNEDTLYLMQGKMPAASPSHPSIPFVLLILADGMGVQGHGQLASRLAVQSLVEYMTYTLRSQQKSLESFLSILSTGVQYANQTVYERSQQHTTMGTTMTSALLTCSTAYVAHVGDSRLYLSRQPAGLTQITRDHSVVASLVARGDLAPEGSYVHPRRNVINRCLGVKAIVEVDSCIVPLAAGDLLLLCSDGLWEMTPDQEIAAILARPASTPTYTAQALIQAALAGGGKDNVSAMVAWVSTKIV